MTSEPTTNGGRAGTRAAVRERRFCVEDAEVASAEAAPGVAPLGRAGGEGLAEPGRAI